MSKASEVAAALTARIATITIANGFATDIGSGVYRGRPTIEQSDLPCSVLVEGEDQVEDAKVSGMVKLAQRYIIEGHDACDPLQPNDKAHMILADLKRAIFSGDKTLGKSVHELRYVGRNIGVRPDGTAIVAASIEIETVYVEDLTNP